jgi:hypothetical protein
MLPLIILSQAEIDRVVEQTPGGVANIQDIYSLSPFQDGILFHHLTAESDPCLLSVQMAFGTRDLLDRYLQAFQEVVKRHDILRTAFIWKDISTPAQVVWRQVSLPLQELKLNTADGPISKQLDQLFHNRIDLTQAPLIRFIIAQDTDGRWVLLQLLHHLIGYHAATGMLNHEIGQILHGQGHNLPTPHSFRNTIAQVCSESCHDIRMRFFKDMLGDIDEPTFPYGVTEVLRNGAEAMESHSVIPQNLNNRLRFQAKQMGVSLASLCHVALALVLARITGQERVVFGSVLFGGTQSTQEAGHELGPFTNTLPFRCDIGSQGVKECVHQTHTRLAALLEHGRTSITLAQRCSRIPAGTPLFSTRLNYLCTSLPSGSPVIVGKKVVNREKQMYYPGIEFIGGWERIDHPFAISVLDSDMALGLTVQTFHPVDPNRVAGYMEQALENLAVSLECDSDIAVAELDVSPIEERNFLLHGLNTLTMDFAQHQVVHHLFEQQVELTPQATAVVFDEQLLTYAELNEHANRLAHHLISLGVQPDMLVAICVERSLAMIIGVLAILKAGGAFVPLDPSYASDRLRDILLDATPIIVIADVPGRMALGEAATFMTVVDPNEVQDTSHRLER